MGKIFDRFRPKNGHVARRVPQDNGKFTAECECGWQLNDLYSGELAGKHCQQHYKEKLGYNSDDYLDHAYRCRSKVKW